MWSFHSLSKQGVLVLLHGAFPELFPLVHRRLLEFRVNGAIRFRRPQRSPLRMGASKDHDFRFPGAD